MSGQLQQLINNIETNKMEDLPSQSNIPLSEIWRRYKASQSDSTLEDMLLAEYAHMVKTIVNRIAIVLPPHIDKTDLYNVGLIGLLSAIRSYDPTTGTPFERYAKWRIKGAILDELRKMDWIPRSVRDKAKKIQHAMMAVEQRQGKVASEEEVAAELGISVSEYQHWLTEVKPASFVSLDETTDMEEGNGYNYHSLIEDKKQRLPSINVERKELIQIITQRINQLPDMHRKVLALYYHEGLRLSEIAYLLGISESRVSQIHTQAIFAIKAYLRKMGYLQTD